MNFLLLYLNYISVYHGGRNVTQLALSAFLQRKRTLHPWWPGEDAARVLEGQGEAQLAPSLRLPVEEVQLAPQDRRRHSRGSTVQSLPQPRRDRNILCK